MSRYVHRFRKLFFCAAALVLIACDEKSPLLISSGSSSFSFLEHFIEPVLSSVIALDTDSNTDRSDQLPQPPDMILKEATELETTREVFDVDYCRYFAANFGERLDSEYLTDSDPTADSVRNAPFLAEKSYFELMKSYCYTRLVIADQESFKEQNHDIHGKVHWHRDVDSNLDDDLMLDYLASQSDTDSESKLLAVFRQTGSLDNEQQRRYGRLKFKQQKSDNSREFSLIRYFVDDRTKSDESGIPDTFRQEGYAMATSENDNGKKVHHIATYYIDYQSNKADSESNRLIISHNTAVVHEEFGSRIVEAEYCVYPDLSGPVHYECDPSADTKASITDSVYYTRSGSIETNVDTTIKEHLVGATKEELLDALKSEFAARSGVPAPVELTKGIMLDALFDTSGRTAHLNF